MTFIFETIRLGLTNLRLHLLRSVLTALGIILGVAAVIAMVAIGEGSTRQALIDIERLGARNIIVRSQRPPETAQVGNSQGRSSMVIRYGVTRADLEVIRQNFPDASCLVPLKEVGGQVLRNERRKTSQAYGTTPDLLRVARLGIDRGRYITQRDLDDRAMVAVIGKEIAKEFFPLEDPIGGTIRVEDKAFMVVGVLRAVGLAGGAGSALIGRDLNLDLHIPLSTAGAVFGDTIVRRQSGSFNATEVQVSEIYIESPARDRVVTDAARLERILRVTHPTLQDIGLIVPYELLEEARRKALTGRVISGAIACISLLVGGIGIMNIMLATVTERTREIGIRRAVGATRRHILWQFLVETSVLSTSGGIIGVALGVAMALFLDWAVPRLPKLALIGPLVPTDVSLPMHVTWWSIAVAFIVATLIGLVFGLYPARKAARQDPIVALRHD